MRLLLWLFVSLSVGSLLIHAMNPGGTADASPESKFQSFVIGTLFLHGAALLLLAHFLRQHGTGWVEGFGLNAPDLPRALMLAAGACVAVLPVAIGLSMASAEVMRLLAEATASDALAPVPQQAVRTLQQTTDTTHRVVFGIFAVVVAPVVEEMLFRGVLYPAIKQNGWPRGAWWATSLLFAVTHSNAMTLVSLFVLSMLLIWLYERTANLAAPILTHSLFNATNLVFLIQQQAAQPPPGP